MAGVAEGEETGGAEAGGLTKEIDRRTTMLYSCCAGGVEACVAKERIEVACLR